VTDSSARLESLIDAQLRMAQERGDFENLPGSGKPLPKTHSPEDELWWIKDYVRREGLPTEAMLPTSLQLSREIERLPDRVGKLASEQLVREVVADLNRRVTDYLRLPSGPYAPVRRVDPDEVVRDWQAARQASPSPTATDVPPTAPRRRRWFGRRQRSDGYQRSDG
jgi:hypothetical protein